MCQRRSGGCTSVYSEAPARRAASAAMTSVLRSNDPPWKARKPNPDRSSTDSSTPGCRMSSSNMVTDGPRVSKPRSPPQGMVLGHLDDGDAQPVGVGDPHLAQPPRLALWRPEDLDPRLDELAVGRVHVAHLQPQPHGRAGQLVPLGLRQLPRDLEESAAQEVHHPLPRVLTELAVDGQPQRPA